MKAIWTCFVKAEIEEVIRALNGEELNLKKKSRERLARRLQRTLDNQESEQTTMSDNPVTTIAAPKVLDDPVELRKMVRMLVERAGDLDICPYCDQPLPHTYDCSLGLVINEEL